MAWHLVSAAAPGAANPFYAEFVVDSDTDITNEPDWKTFLGYKPCVGSVAYSVVSGGTGMDQMWMRASDETWSEM